jgi:hypothetical protein
VLALKQARANPQMWNRYAYVRNNPIASTDPTGKYTCDGSVSECAAVVIAVNDTRRAAEYLTRHHLPGATALTTISNLYGRPGETNGTVVKVTDLKASIAGNAETHGIGPFKTTTIQVNREEIAANANSDGSVEGRVALAETVAHEGSHGVDQRADGMPVTVRYFMATESRAYRTEGFVDMAFGVNGSNGIWTLLGGFNTKAIEQGAESSVREVCGNGECPP